MVVGLRRVLHQKQAEVAAMKQESSDEEESEEESAASNEDEGSDGDNSEEESSGEEEEEAEVCCSKCRSFFARCSAKHVACLLTYCVDSCDGQSSSSVPPYRTAHSLSSAFMGVNSAAGPQIMSSVKLLAISHGAACSCPVK